ncbi:MAG: pentapeptide repeat-containing protein [Elainellaceae cyanobacterium]
MQSSVSSSLQCIEQDNRCPSLLSLEIQVEATDDSQSSAHGADDHGKSGVEIFDVYVSLSAGDHWQDLGDGKVQMAIAQATLTMSLTDAQFTPAETLATPEQGAFQLAGSEPICDAAGHPSAATFTIFSASDALLSGAIHTVKVGQVLAQQPSWSLMAIAKTTAQHICITDAEGLWRHDITPNKHGIIERRLAISLHDSLLSPHLCRLQLCHACPDHLPTAKYNSPALDEDDLRETIQAILDAPTSNLLDLAQRAGLVVETDLSRISLRGASLSGLDLSNVDLSYANLRGADLTDAELSEANVSRAKLGGADLSGAHLGSADLSYCDLHRASLAVANLSGANLSHANLQDANLSQTNLNGVYVHQAQFSGQSALPADLQASLKARGAIFQ